MKSGPPPGRRADNAGSLGLEPPRRPAASCTRPGTRRKHHVRCCRRSGRGPFAAPAAPIAREITSRSRHLDSGCAFLACMRVGLSAASHMRNPFARVSSPLVEDPSGAVLNRSRCDVVAGFRVEAAGESADCRGVRGVVTGPRGCPGAGGGAIGDDFGGGLQAACGLDFVNPGFHLRTAVGRGVPRVFVEQHVAKSWLKGRVRNSVSEGQARSSRGRAGKARPVRPRPLMCAVTGALWAGARGLGDSERSPLESACPGLYVDASPHSKAPSPLKFMFLLCSYNGASSSSSCRSPCIKSRGVYRDPSCNPIMGHFFRRQATPFGSRNKIACQPCLLRSGPCACIVRWPTAPLRPLRAPRYNTAKHIMAIIGNPHRYRGRHVCG